MKTLQEGNMRIGTSLNWMFILLFCISGCAPDLIVRNPEVNWDQTNKTARAEIANIGYRDAGKFLVYFNGDENPVSTNNIPQVTHKVPGLARGDSVVLESDFAPLAHPDNNNLGNVYKITVIADPKYMVKESNENNNERSVEIFRAKSELIFDVNSGSAGVSGYGSQGPTGNNLIFSIDSDGWTLFEDYTHVTFSGSVFPSSLQGTTIQLINGEGRYNFDTSVFSNLRFDVRVENDSGDVTVSNHSFSGQTTEILSIPVGGSPPIGVGLQLVLSTPYSIDLGSGLSGNVIINANCISATDL